MTNKDRLFETAQKFLVKGQFAKAIGEYQKLVDAFPKDYRHRHKLAELLCREKRAAEALPHFEAVARNFAETGFHLKAIAIYRQMQKLDPSRADTYLQVAELNAKHGLVGNALSEYRNLVAYYEQHGLNREAVAVLQKMIALAPDHCGLRGKLIELLMAAGDDEQALEPLLALVELLEAKGDHAAVAKLHEKYADSALLQELLATTQAAGVATAPPAAPLVGAETPPAGLDLSNAPGTVVGLAAGPAALPVEPELTPAPAFELELEFELDSLEEVDDYPAPAEPATEISADEFLLTDPAGIDYGLNFPAARPGSEVGATIEPADAGQERSASKLADGDDRGDEVYEALEEIVPEAESAELTELAETSEATSGGGAGVVDEDAQSHFDLGIAYRGMGMLAEAISEFARAARDPSRMLDCLTMKGQCLLECGEIDAAEAAFKEALAHPALTDAVRIVLRYELGLLYESSARPLEALENFAFVAERDQFFRDVAVKHKELRRWLGLDEEGAAPVSDRPGRDRISYL